MLHRKALAALNVLTMWFSFERAAIAKPPKQIVGLKVCTGEENKKDCMIFRESTLLYEQHRRGRPPSQHEISVTYHGDDTYTAQFGREQRMEKYEIHGKTFKTTRLSGNKEGAIVEWRIQ